MLRIVEETVLLTLRDEGGSFVRVPTWSRRYSLAGGVLMDLALENRIDTDPKRLILLDDTPLGDSMLDAALAQIAADEGGRDTRHWLDLISNDSDEIYEEVLASLTSKGILEKVEGRVLWVFRARRYPEIQGAPRREVKLRLLEVLFGDEIPEPRDVMLICLADACGILKAILTSQELDQVSGRLSAVRKLDLIGREMTAAIDEVLTAIAAATGMHLH